MLFEVSCSPCPVLLLLGVGHLEKTTTVLEEVCVSRPRRFYIAQVIISLYCVCFCCIAAVSSFILVPLLASVASCSDV
jgi:hypothetical protein